MREAQTAATFAIAVLIVVLIVMQYRNDRDVDRFVHEVARRHEAQVGALEKDVATLKMVCLEVTHHLDGNDMAPTGMLRSWLRPPDYPPDEVADCLPEKIHPEAAGDSFEADLARYRAEAAQDDDSDPLLDEAEGMVEAELAAAAARTGIPVERLRAAWGAGAGAGALDRRGDDSDPTGLPVVPPAIMGRGVIPDDASERTRGGAD